jgi:hypothetical protein
MSAAPTAPLASPPEPEVPPKEPVDWLAFYLLTGFFTYIFIGYFRAPLFPGDTFGVILGYMAGWVSAWVMFRYGSSVGSRTKDGTISKLSKP